VSNDLSAYDKSQYKLSVAPNASSGDQVFHLGQPITVKWEAPHGHSRKDWIGLYRVNRLSCDFDLVTECGIGWGKQVDPRDQNIIAGHVGACAR
jgi:hypothetical protein